MSRTKSEATEDASASKSRKRKAESQELEINIDAPEPPSKKALRKAKRLKLEPEPIVERKVKEPVDMEESKGRSPYSIWIGNLPFFVTKNELQRFLTGDTNFTVDEADITRIHLPLSSEKRGPKPQNKGFAYVDFVNATSQEMALQLSEKLLLGRRVLIKNGKNFEGRPDKPQQEPQVSRSKRVFLGNLGFDTTKDSLEEHFRACGPLEDIHIATFEDSGKCKGYAWINFGGTSSAAAAAVRGWAEAINKDDSRGNKTSSRRTWVNKMGGRKLRIEFAEDKTARYDKRFGKGARKAGVPTEPQDEDEAADGKEMRASTIGDSSQLGEKLVGRVVANATAKKRGARYEDSTVSKLTGAIVDSEGRKTTFE